MVEEVHKYVSYDHVLLSECVDNTEALGTDWLFRGQPDAPISSSLERETQRLKNAEPAAYEANTLKQIKLVSSYPECWDLEGKDDFSWLALLQHYGCRTRLVDFTESFYVALYFAIRDLPCEKPDGVEGDSAVWAIKRSALDGEMYSLNEDLSDEELPRRLLNNALELPERYEDSPDSRLAVVYCRPEKPNLRMIAQQGIFLAPLNLKHSFQENLVKGLKLSSMEAPTKHIETPQQLQEASKQAKVIKIRVPQIQHRSLLFHLKRMNMSEATLFPGLDGYARSLNYYAVGME